MEVYAELGELCANDMVSFAYQIASGMVRISFYDMVYTKFETKFKFVWLYFVRIIL